MPAPNFRPWLATGRRVTHRDVARFITEHWPLCQTRRCLLVDSEFSIVRGF